MNKIFGGRGTGKTIKMLEALNNTDTILVTKDVQSMKEKAFALGFKNVTMVSYDEYFYNYGADSKPAYIHDVEKYLEFIHMGPIQGFTCSVD